MIVLMPSVLRVGPGFGPPRKCLNPPSGTVHLTTALVAALKALSCAPIVACPLALLWGRGIASGYPANLYRMYSSNQVCPCWVCLTLVQVMLRRKSCICGALWCCWQSSGQFIAGMCMSKRCARPAGCPLLGSCTCTVSSCALWSLACPCASIILSRIL